VPAWLRCGERCGAFRLTVQSEEPADFWLGSGADEGLVVRLISTAREAGAPLVLIDVARSMARARWLALGAAEALPPGARLPELLQRLRQLRDRPAARHIVRCGPLRLDLIERSASRDGAPLRLMPREFDLLRYLVARPGEHITRTDLLRDVWKLGFDPGTNSVEVHIFRLRQSLDRPFGWPMLLTEPGGGYRLVAAPASPGPEAQPETQPAAPFCGCLAAPLWQWSAAPQGDEP